MKTFLTSLIILITACTAFCQTPFDMISSHDNAAKSGFAYGPVSSSASSVANGWYGATVAMNFKGDVGNSVLVGGRAMYLAVYGDKYAIPILTNVSLNSTDSLSTQDQFTVGILPYYTLVTNDRLRLLLHGGFNYAIPDLSNTDASEFNILAGFEVALYPNEGGLPFTLSIAPEYSMSIQNTSLNGWNLGIEGVVPITNGMGILLSTTIPFESNITTDFNIGVIINGAIK